MSNTMTFQDYLSMSISLGMAGLAIWVLNQPWCF